MQYANCARVSIVCFDVILEHLPGNSPDFVATSAQIWNICRRKNSGECSMKRSGRSRGLRRARYETRVESTGCFQLKRVSVLKELEIPMISSSVKTQKGPRKNREPFTLQASSPVPSGRQHSPSTQHPPAPPPPASMVRKKKRQTTSTSRNNTSRGNKPKQAVTRRAQE